MTINVNWVVALPSAVSDVGDADKVLVALVGVPLAKVTVACTLSASSVAAMVLSSAVLDANVVVYTPALLVVPVGLPKKLLDPVLAKDTV